MTRILIFGNSGAGKSTLATKLQNELNLAHLDLDTLAWLDVIPPERKPYEQSVKDIESFMHNKKEWVIEGCYSDLLSYVAEKANELIFLNPGSETCIKHCKERPWEPHKYKSKQEQDANLDMLIDWVKKYEERDDEFSLQSHKALFDAFKGKKIEINE